MMLLRSLFPIILVSIFAVHTSSQYVDFLQGFQTFFQSYPLDGSMTTKKPANRHGGRHPNKNNSNPTIVFPTEVNVRDRPKTSGTTPKPSKKTTRPNSSQSPTTRPKSANLQNTRYQTTPSNKSKPKSNENRRNDFGLFNNDNIFFPNDDVTTNSNRKTTQWGSKNNNRNPEVPYSITDSGSKNNRKPVVDSSQWNNRNDNRKPVVSSTEWNNKNDNRNPASTNKNNNRNPDVSAIKKPLPSLGNWNNGNVGTTRRPLPSRPGVRPAPVDESKPPITNRPVESVFAATPKPIGSNDEPELEIGPDEDDMSTVEKRQYLAIAEEMCENYKALNVKKVVALPLRPTPEVVELNVSDCRAINIPLIVGGQISSIEDFPHMALVGWKNAQSYGYTWKCGGSLISDQYVLTAGHCTYFDKDANVVSGRPVAVQLGSTYVDGPKAVVMKISSVIRHPKYKLRRSYYDVALLKLASRVGFSDVIKPACLGVPPRVGQPIVATGWGKTEYGDQSLELRSVSLPIWDMQECKEIWGTSLKLPNGPSSESHVCAGVRAGGKDTCQGDSGGPAQLRDGCVWRVVAVTSSGRSCAAPDTPALYAKIPLAFVAAEVFRKKYLDKRINNKINSDNNVNINNRNTNNQNNYNQNNRNTNNQNNNVYYNVNDQNNRDTNYNTQTTQNSNNQNNYNQQNNNNQNNRNTNQYNQDNNYNQQNNRVTTAKPNQFYNQENFNQNNFNQNQNNFNQNQNNFNQNQNNFNQNQNNQNQYYSQNSYVTEGWNQNNAYGLTNRPRWSR